MNRKQHIIDSFTITEYLNSNIFVIENVFEKDFCSELIEKMDKSENIKLFYSNHNNVECYKILNFNYENIIENINKKIYNMCKAIKKIQNIVIEGVTEIELRKVYGRTRLHTDGTCPGDKIINPVSNDVTKIVRSITLVGCLNDDYDGGIYNFPVQNIQIKLKAGSFILFPPYWTHSHEVSSIIKKENGVDHRYIISCWGLDDFLIKDYEYKLNNIVMLSK
jgi:hypothetical protein